MRVDIHRREKPRVKNPRGRPPTLQDERRAKANPMGRRALRLSLNMGGRPPTRGWRRPMEMRETPRMGELLNK